MKIAVVQMNSQNNKEKNMLAALDYIDSAAKDGADLISLPEYFNFLGDKTEKVGQAESIPGPTSEALIEKAKEHDIYIHSGSFLEAYTNDKSYNTSLLINKKGEITGTYRKIHLFDMEIEDKVSAKESDTIMQGNKVVTVHTEYAPMGLSICYDLRFSELYRSMALDGAKILFIPSAFALYTGIHHWEVLLRARAIENQCYVVAAAQIGEANNEPYFGSSMIIDPWGTVIARVPEREGYIIADVDIQEVDKIRENVPCFSHRMPELYTLN